MFNNHKVPLSFEEQADRLISQGLICSKNKLIQKLKAVNYYRLKGYWYPFREKISDNPPTHRFKTNTNFDNIWRLYRFDRKLKLLVFDAIERVEISIRTQFACLHSKKYGALGYTDINNFVGMKADDHKKLLRKYSILNILSSKSLKPIFVMTYHRTYPNEKYFPFWMLIELVDFGFTDLVFQNGTNVISPIIARNFGVKKKKFLISWLNALRGVRNICAHHSRLFNRNDLYQVDLPENDLWDKPLRIHQIKKIIARNGEEVNKITNQRTLFPILSVLAYMLNIIIPESKWKDRVKDLLKEFPEVPKGAMGFPDNWEESLIWR